MHLRRLAAATLALVIAGGAVSGVAPASAAWPGAASTAAAATDRVHVRPVDAAGHLRPGYRISDHHGRASCLLGGIAVGTALRCFAGNDHIYDPCWVQAGGTDHVVCLMTPWRHRVVRLHVTRGFDGSYGSVLALHPWGVRLADGTRCVGSQGAAGQVQGFGISYLCLDGKTVLLEDPNTGDDVWRIRVARDPAGGYDYDLAGFQPIDAVYYGRRSLNP